MSITSLRRRLQEKREEARAKGLCTKCLRKAVLHESLCKHCKQISNEGRRKRNAAKTWKVNKNAKKQEISFDDYY